MLIIIGTGENKILRSSIIFKLLKNVCSICLLSVLFVFCPSYLSFVRPICLFFQCGPVGLSTLRWPVVRRTPLSYPMWSRRPDHVKVVRPTQGASFLFFQCGPVGLSTLWWPVVRRTPLSYPMRSSRPDHAKVVRPTQDAPIYNQYITNITNI